MQTKKAFIVAIITAALWLSCAKQGLKNEKPELPDNSSSGLATEGGRGGGSPDCNNPANPLNPWDSVGIYHNQAMNYVKQQSEGVDKTLSNYLGFANDYVISLFDRRDTNLPSKLFTASAVESLLSDTTDFYERMINRSSFSRNGKSYLNELISYLKDTSNDNSTEYCQLKERVMQVENEIQADEYLGSDEKDKLLMITSVARYSLFHWNNEYQGRLSGGETGTEKKRKWWQWLIIGIADVAGGIVGATVGSPTGVGAVAGAVAGAAGASGGAAGAIGE